MDEILKKELSEIQERIQLAANAAGDDTLTPLTMTLLEMQLRETSDMLVLSRQQFMIRNQ